MGDMADVVIVGAGAGGGSMAWALTKAGVNVTLIEAGPAYDYRTDYHLHRSGWEGQGFPLKAGSQGEYRFGEAQLLDEANRALRSFSYQGFAVHGDQRVMGAYQHVRGVGGATLHFTGEAHRLHPQSFSMLSQFGEGADWPFGYAELESYYDQIESFLRIAGPAASRSGVPRQQPFPQPAHTLCYASQQLQSAGQKIGVHFEQDSLAILSRAHEGRPPCNYCNNCNRGCPRGDKGSVDVTFIPEARRSGKLRLITGAQVLHVQAGEQDKVRAVVYRNQQGMQSIKARVIVLAGGAIETPRLMLASAQNGSEHGLGNDTEQLGRHLMETVFLVRGGLSDLPLGNWRGIPSDVVSWDYAAADSIVGVVGGFRLGQATVGAGMNGPRAYARHMIKGWGRDHKKRMRDQFGRAMYIGALSESLPHPKSKVSLSDDHDASGMPIAKITAWLGPHEIKRMAFMKDRVDDVLNAMQVHEVMEQNSVFDQFSSSHVYGTCRMGNDPEQSVTDAYGRVHRWQNLYVADASLFPSSGSGESPSLTIEALSLRAAEHIAARLAAREL